MNRRGFLRLLGLAPIAAIVGCEAAAPAFPQDGGFVVPAHLQGEVRRLLHSGGVVRGGPVLDEVPVILRSSRTL